MNTEEINKTHDLISELEMALDSLTLAARAISPERETQFSMFIGARMKKYRNQLDADLADAAVVEQ